VSKGARGICGSRHKMRGERKNELRGKHNNSSAKEEGERETLRGKRNRERRQGGKLADGGKFSKRGTQKSF